MRYRDKTDVAAAFAQVAKDLDAALAHLRSTGGSQDLEIDDRCNRSGFDWSGFGQPRWGYVFRRTWNSGSYRVVNEAEVFYEEPILTGAAREVGARWVSDVFSVGAAWSASKETGNLVVSVSDLVGAGLEEVVKLLLSSAAGHTPPEHAR